MKTIFYFFTILCSCYLLSCNGSISVNQVATIEGKPKLYAKEPNDSADYKHLKFDFYVHKDSNLCERKLVPSDDTLSTFTVFYDSTFKFYYDDTVIRKSLGSIVDINSFEWIGTSQYSKDKKHVYYFHENSDGGNRQIVDGADVKTFKWLCEYRWGIDKNHVYYKDNQLHGLNLKELVVLHSQDTTNHFVDYIRDGRLVYYGNNIVEGADAKTFKVSKEKEWDAEDKLYKYSAGNRLRSF